MSSISPVSGQSPVVPKNVKLKTKVEEFIPTSDYYVESSHTKTQLFKSTIDSNTKKAIFQSIKTHVKEQKDATLKIPTKTAQELLSILSTLITYEQENGSAKKDVNGAPIMDVNSQKALSETGTDETEFTTLYTELEALAKSPYFSSTSTPSTEPEKNQEELHKLAEKNKKKQDAEPTKITRVKLSEFFKEGVTNFGTSLNNFFASSSEPLPPELTANLNVGQLRTILSKNNRKIIQAIALERHSDLELKLNVNKEEYDANELAASNLSTASLTKEAVDEKRESLKNQESYLTNKRDAIERVTDLISTQLNEGSVLDDVATNFTGEKLQAVVEELVEFSQQLEYNTRNKNSSGNLSSARIFLGESFFTYVESNAGNKTATGKPRIAISNNDILARHGEVIPVGTDPEALRIARAIGEKIAKHAEGTEVALSLPQLDSAHYSVSAFLTDDTKRGFLIAELKKLKIKLNVSDKNLVALKKAVIEADGNCLLNASDVCWKYVTVSKEVDVSALPLTQNETTKVENVIKYLLDLRDKAPDCDREFRKDMLKNLGTQREYINFLIEKRGRVYAPKTRIFANSLSTIEKLLPFLNDGIDPNDLLLDVLSAIDGITEIHTSTTVSVSQCVKFVIEPLLSAIIKIQSFQDDIPINIATKFISHTITLLEAYIQYDTTLAHRTDVLDRNKQLVEELIKYLKTPEIIQLSNYSSVISAKPLDKVSATSVAFAPIDKMKAIVGAPRDDEVYTLNYDTKFLREFYKSFKEDSAFLQLHPDITTTTLEPIYCNIGSLKDIKEGEFDADEVSSLIIMLKSNKLNIETLFSTFGFALPDITAGVSEDIVAESITCLEQLSIAAAESNVKIKQHSLDVLTNYYKATCGLLEKFQNLPVVESV